jgi:large subunit ribosomal protein L21
MYAVVNSGGKQYKVQQGQVLRVEKIPGDVGNPVTFERVLMFSDGENVSIGQPALEDIVVEGHIVEQGKAKKIIVFKYKKRKRYRRKKGHRQEFTAVLIDDIKPKAQKVSETKDEPEAETKKPEAEKAAPKKAEAESESPKKEATMKAETTAVPAEKAESEQETE